MDLAYDFDPATYGMQCTNEVEVTMLGEVREKTNNLYKKVLPLFFEQTNYQVIIEANGSHQVAFDHDSKLIRDRVDQLINLFNQSVRILENKMERTFFGQV